MRCKLALILAASMLAAKAPAQWWEGVGLPGLVDGVEEIYEDTATNTMYCLGALQLGLGQPYVFQKYQNGSWTASEPFNSNVHTARKYNDTLVVGGGFSYIGGDPIYQTGGQPIRYIAAYANGQWIPYGTFNGRVRALRVLGGSLYAVGVFTEVDGALCGGVAKREGGHWVPVGNMPATHDSPYWTDITLYQGNLVVTGTATFENLPFKHIIQYDGQNWVPLGQGILTSMGGGGCLAVYHNELYVGGIFKLSEGNVGHCIMRWNGQAWHPVGTSVQDETGGYQYAIGVTELLVKDDLLFACGGFNYAGNVPAAYTATWDGDRWCGFGGSMDPMLGAVGMGFYGDTLFVGCGISADGQPVNHLVRYIGEEWGDSCSVPMGDIGMGMAPPPNKDDPAYLANLGNGEYRVVGEVTGSQLRVFDASGRLQRVLLLHPGPNGTEPFSLAGLAAGSYVLDLGGQWRGRVVLAP